MRTLRPTSSTVSLVIVGGIVVFVLGDLILRGAWTLLARVLTWALLAAWAYWMILWRTRLQVGDRRIVIQNFARITEIPWARVTELRERPVFTVVLDSAATVASWAVNVPRTARGSSRYSETIERVDEIRAAAPPSDAPVIRSWDLLGLLTGGVLLAIALLSILIL